MFYPNVVLSAIIPLIVLYALVMLFRSGKPKRFWLLIVTLTPFKPSHGLTHLFPGVETPPDPAHSDAIPTEIDRRTPKPLPNGTRRKTDGV